MARTVFLALLLLLGSAQAATYRVRPGDSLFVIGQRLGVSEGALRAANPRLNRAGTLYAGQVLQLPSRGYVVKRGDTLARIAQRSKIPERVWRQSNPQIGRSGALSVGQVLRRPPASAVRPSVPAGGYRVKAGDSLALIALRSKIPERVWRQSNPQINRAGTLAVGQVLRRPPASAVRPSVPAGGYRVKAGDSLALIALRSKIPERVWRQSNPQIGRSGALSVGQILRRPPASAVRPSAPARASAPVTTYRVRPGDTLSRISGRLGVPLATLKAANPGVRSDRLLVGQVLRLRPKAPESALVNPARRYRVQPGDTLYAIARRTGVSVTTLRRANPQFAPGALPVGATLSLSAPASRPAVVRAARSGGVWAWPLPGYGRITSGYGERELGGSQEFHSGTDIGAPSGTPVQAARSGRVLRADFSDSAGWGGMVLIQHPDGWRSRYAHLSRISVRAGELVRQGEVIGRVGSTGRVTGPHLHFGLYKAGASRDPLGVLGQGND